MKLFRFISRNKKILKNAALFAAALAVFAAIQPGSAAGGMNADKEKSETVYAVLANDGSYTGSSVVSCFTRGGEITDYGAYLNVRSLSGPEQPVLEGNKVIWSTGAAPFYYEGETQKPLPFSIGIKYYLNGIEERPEDIAGKTGELKIEFAIRNETDTGEIDELTEREVLTPFAVSVSMTLDNSKFTVTDKPDNASCVLAGETLTLSYASFPLPEDTFSFTMFGKDISLEPFNIVVLPKSPPGLDSYGDFVDVDGIKEGADEMIEGADDMRSGVGDLLEALKQMKDAAKLLKNGIDTLDDGTGELSGGAGELYSNARLLKASANDFYTGFSNFAVGMAALGEGIQLLNTNVEAMCTQLSDLATAAGQLDSGVAGINAGLGGISGTNSGLTSLAGMIDATYPADPNVDALVSGLQGQQSAIEGLASSSGDLVVLSGSVSSGAQGFYTAFSTTFAASVQQLETSAAELYAASLELLNGANALNQGCAQLSGALREMSSGAGELSDGTGEIAAKLPELLEGLDDMIEGVQELYDGIGELNDEGLKELKENFDGLEGYLDKLSAKAAEYGSFMDERNAKLSTVQFVLKTKGIGQEE